MWRSDYCRIAYVLTDLSGAKRSDDGPLREYQLRSGDLAFRPHHRKLWSDLPEGQYIQIIQRPEVYNSFALEMVRGGVLHLEPQDAFNDPLVARMVLTIANELTDQYLDTLLADTLNIALATQIARRFVDRSAIIAPVPSNGLSRERLNRVRDYIEAHLDEDLSLTMLADIACLSPCHFSRSLKRAVGVGPRRYVIQRRVERAKRLLRQTREPLALIAQEAGFADQSHLTQMFRREMGVTPGRFRAAMA